MEYSGEMGEGIKNINPFVPNAPFLYPLKTLKTLRSSGGRERVHWEQVG